jgi:hypothetical protein
MLARTRNLLPSIFSSVLAFAGDSTTTSVLPANWALLIFALAGAFCVVVLDVVFFAVEEAFLVTVETFLAVVFVFFAALFAVVLFLQPSVYLFQILMLNRPGPDEHTAPRADNTAMIFNTSAAPILTCSAMLSTAHVVFPAQNRQHRQLVFCEWGFVCQRALCLAEQRLL